MRISTIEKETEIFFMGRYAATPNFFSSSHYATVSRGTLKKKKKAPAEGKVRGYVEDQ